ncbi:MAG: 50S ribosomal protein L24 [Candidatus Thorarchaeota archaeon]|nr:50S ribosomal protein L24 [Candidatus Thorarchaeota archaeon]
MKKISSKSPRKQRNKVQNSPLHTHKNMLKCKLDEFLQEEHGIKTLVVKKGDLVKIMRGQFRDTEAKVTRVDYKDIRVYLDSAVVTKADGKEAPVPVHPSNLMIVKLELDDERKKIIERKLLTVAESEE